MSVQTLADLLDGLAKEQVEVEKLGQELQNKAAIFDANCKAALGICNGEKTGVVQMAQLVEKLVKKALE